MKGELIAPDGWRMEWEIHAGRGEVRIYDYRGVQQEIVSGHMPTEFLARTQANFMDKHDGQMRMAL